MRLTAQITTLTQDSPDRVRGDLRDLRSGMSHEFEMDVDAPLAREIKVGAKVAYHLEATTGAPKIDGLLQASMKTMTLVHPDTGWRREVKLGFSWTTLMFAPLGGIPLIARKLTLPGLTIAGLTAFHYLAVMQASPMPGAAMPYIILGMPMDEAMLGKLNMGLFVAEAALSTFFGAHANRWFARSLVKRGFRLPQSASEAEIGAFHAYVGMSGRSSGYGQKIDPAPTATPNAAKAAYAGASISRQKLRSVFGTKQSEPGKATERM